MLTEHQGEGARETSTGPTLGQLRLGTRGKANRGFEGSFRRHRPSPLLVAHWPELGHVSMLRDKVPQGCFLLASELVSLSLREEVRMVRPRGRGGPDRRHFEVGS